MRRGNAKQPQFLLDTSCAQRDRVAVHALSCGCAGAQRDARRRSDVLRGPSGRAVTFWRLARGTRGRAVPSVRRHAELAHSNAASCDVEPSAAKHLLTSVQAGARRTRRGREWRLLVRLRVERHALAACADHRREAGEARDRVHVRRGKKAHLLVLVRVAEHASLSGSERQNLAGVIR